MGSVSHLFERLGVLDFERAGVDADALLEAGLEAGADDVVEGESNIEVITDPKNFETVRDALIAKGFEPSNAEITMRASTTAVLEGAQAKSMLDLVEALEDLDDVQDVYSNFDISDAEMERLS